LQRYTFFFIATLQTAPKAKEKLTSVFGKRNAEEEGAIRVQVKDSVFVRGVSI